MKRVWLELADSVVVVVAVAAVAVLRRALLLLALVGLVRALVVLVRLAGLVGLALRVLLLAGVLVLVALFLIVLALGLVVALAGEDRASPADHEAERADGNYEGSTHTCGSCRCAARRRAIRLADGPQLDLIELERRRLVTFVTKAGDDVVELVFELRAMVLGLAEEHLDP